MGTFLKKIDLYTRVIEKFDLNIFKIAVYKVNLLYPLFAKISKFAYLDDFADN